MADQDPDPVAEEIAKGEESNKAAEALRIARELEEKLKNASTNEAANDDVDPAELINSPDFKEKAKIATGMTDAQVEFVIKTANVASANANAESALLKVSAKHRDFAQFEKAIAAELKLYPLDKRGNATIIEKLYYVEKGKHAEKNGSRENAGGRPPIRGGGVTGEGLERGNSGGTGADSLDNEERYVARKMGVSEKDYAKSKTTKLINDLIE